MIMAMVLIGELGWVYWLIHVYEEMSANLSRLYSFDHLFLSKTWLRKIPVAFFGYLYNDVRLHNIPFYKCNYRIHGCCYTLH